MSDFYEHLIDFFTPDEAKRAEDLEVEEDVDLWDLFQCWLWGEKYDHSATKSKKQVNPDSDDSEENTFKEHKRKDDVGEEEEEEEEETEEVGLFGNIFKVIGDILSDDGKSRQHGSRGR